MMVDTNVKKGDKLILWSGREFTITKFNGKFFETVEGQMFAPSHPNIERIEKVKKQSKKKAEPKKEQQEEVAEEN